MDTDDSTSDLHGLSVRGHLDHVASTLLTIDELRRGCALLVLCDAHDRLLTALCVDEVPIGCDEWEQHSFVTLLARIGNAITEVYGLGLIVGRGGHPVATEWDRVWGRAFGLACEEVGLDCVGVAMATPAGVVFLDDDVAAA